MSCAVVSLALSDPERLQSRYNVPIEQSLARRRCVDGALLLSRLLCGCCLVWRVQVVYAMSILVLSG
eukprot:6169041-Lingulodinium_polyedra.AAC.1